MGVPNGTSDVPIESSVNIQSFINCIKQSMQRGLLINFIACDSDVLIREKCPILSKLRCTIYASIWNRKAESGKPKSQGSSISLCVVQSNTIQFVLV